MENYFSAMPFSWPENKMQNSTDGRWLNAFLHNLPVLHERGCTACVLIRVAGARFLKINFIEINKE